MKIRQQCPATNPGQHARKARKDKMENEKLKGKYVNLLEPQ
jgi:hypothetical protein